MSVEKCFAVYFPFKSKTVCTVRTAKWATGIVGFILAGYDSVYFYAMESRLSKGRHDCFFIDGKYGVSLNAVDSVLYSYGHFTFVTYNNFCHCVQIHDS